jgi:type IV secretion system protein VirD4
MSRSALVGLVASALLLALGAFAVATQYVAAALAYQARLGMPAASPFGLRVYAPWSWIEWDADYEPYAPVVFGRARLLAAVPSALGLAVVLGACALRARTRERSTAHGSARWASYRELARAGLRSGSGVVLCQTAEARYSRAERADGSVRWTQRRAGRLVTHSGPEHVMVFAPTRSGKGVGTVVPTLLSWSESVLVYDIKKELWALTAGWRRKFSRCWRFEPTARDSIRFNPLLEVRRDDNEVRDAQNVADILVDPNGAEKRDHWKTSAHTLLVGAILHVLYAEEDKSLRGVARFLSDPARPIHQALFHMLGTRHLTSGPHPVVEQCAREMLDKAHPELTSIVSTAKTYVNLYNDPLVARNTATSDFRIEDLMQAPDPVSLYLVVPPSDIDRLRPLMRLVLNQIGRRLTERMGLGAARGYRHRLLLMLDEFPSLGRLSFFETQLAYLAGYGIKAFLIAQSLNQLERAYGQSSSILDNCHVRMTFAANDDRTAKRISDLVGQETHLKTQRTFAGGRVLGRITENEHEHARPLLTPDEVLRLPPEDALLLVAGMAPYRGRKLMYFVDRRFRGRAGLPPPDSPRQRRSELLRGRACSDWEPVGRTEDGSASEEPSAASENARESALIGEPVLMLPPGPPTGAPPASPSQPDAQPKNDSDLEHLPI